MQSETEIRQQICEIGKRMYDRRMVAANDGNISVRLDEHRILCTPTGVSKGFMTPESLCVVDESGKLLEAEGEYRPSSEIRMHVRVYEKRPDVGAVVHAHPVFATSFAVAGIPLDRPVLSEAVVSLGCVPVAEYGTPSTMELPDHLEKYLPYYDAVLLEHHGALTWGADLLTAYFRMESVEYYAELLYRTKMLDGQREFDEEEIKKLYQVRRNMNMTGRHPATFDPALQEKDSDYAHFPGYQYGFVGKKNNTD